MDKLPKPGTAAFESLIHKAEQNIKKQVEQAILGGIPPIAGGSSGLFGNIPTGNPATIQYDSAKPLIKVLKEALNASLQVMSIGGSFKTFDHGPSLPAFPRAAPVCYGRERIRLGDVEIDAEFSVDWDAWDACMRRDEIRTQMT